MGLSTGILGAPANWSPVPATDLKLGREVKGELESQRAISK